MPTRSVEFLVAFPHYMWTTIDLDVPEEVIEKGNDAMVNFAYESCPIDDVALIAVYYVSNTEDND